MLIHTYKMSYNNNIQFVIFICMCDNNYNIVINTGSLFILLTRSLYDSVLIQYLPKDEKQQQLLIQ